ncbi:MAG: hypothetical protein Kow00121_39310 [Elainellaceae cyanobacterium]
MSHFPSNSQAISLKQHPIIVLVSLLLGITVLGLAMTAIQQQLQKYPIQDVAHSLAAIPIQSLGIAIVLTGLNYLMLTGYDTLAVRFAQHPIPYRKTALVAAINYGISNTIGFALLSDSAIRYRFYSSWSFSTKEIAQILVFCHLSFWLGLLTISGIIFLVEPLEIPNLLKLPFHSANIAGGLFLSIVFAYLVWNWLGNRSLQIGKWTVPHVPFQLALAQVAVTSLSWMLATGVLYVLLPATASMSYFSFFSIYLLAQFASLLSTIPGGLGVFETVLLLLLSPPINSAALLGALLAYRGIHYFLPFITAVLLFGLYELRQRLSPSLK